MRIKTSPILNLVCVEELPSSAHAVSLPHTKLQHRKLPDNLSTAISITTTSTLATVEFGLALLITNKT